jgi:diguanylate cyclase (GGDEF)-like protein/PAS domain S-box-containing protein
MDMNTDHIAPCPPEEAARLAALHSYGVLDTAPETGFDDLTVLAARACEMPIALVSLLDSDRSWFKSRLGFALSEAPREVALCSHNLNGPDLLLVPDTLADPRFADNPMVRGTPGIRFFAGAPLVTVDGQVLGSLCVMDHRPRTLGVEQLDTLQRLARQVVQQLELRRLSQSHDQAQARLLQQADELHRLAIVAERTNNNVMLLSLQGKVLWVNAAFRRATGYADHEMLGRKPEALLRVPGTGQGALNELEAARIEHRSCRVQLPNRMRDGSLRWFEVELQPLHDDAGVVQGFSSVATDVTELVQEREFLRTLLQALPVGVMVRDTQARIVEANAAAQTITRSTRAELLGQTFLGTVWEHRHDADGQTSASTHPVLRILAGQAVPPDELMSVRSADGSQRMLRIRAAPLPAADGSLAGVVTVFSDETRQHLQEQMLSVARSAARVAPWTMDLSTYQVRFDVDAGQVMGLTMGDGCTPVDGHVDVAWGPDVHPDDKGEAMAALKRHLDDPSQPYRAEYRMRTRDGSWRWYLACGGVIERRADGRPRTLAGMLLDVDDRRRAQAALERAATTDELTGLPNRRELQRRLQQVLAAAQRRGRCGALLMLDLDHFKRINDSLGHACGDQLLQSLTARLQQALRAEDTLARMGGDELIVVLPEIGDHPEAAALHAQQVADKLLLSLTEPFVLAAGDYSVGASIGITVFPKSDGDTAADLIREADTAMYEAKAAGRGLSRHFRADMQQAVMRRFDIERALKAALGGDELSIHLQPQWHADGALFGAEVLLRWHPADRRPISPAEFIPVAEDSGLILPLGRWVLERAMLLAAEQRAAGRPLKLAVNLSPRQFRDPNFVDHFDELLARTGARASDLTLELTEGVLMDDVEVGARRMAQLADRGASLSIDDFGTGYSSLMYIKRLPIHELKIDQAFVRDVTSNADDASIVRAMLGIASRFGIRTVAEGVETEAQAAFLRAHGCPVLQGYLLGRPVPVDDFLRLYDGTQEG